MWYAGQKQGEGPCQAPLPSLGVTFIAFFLDSQNFVGYIRCPCLVYIDNNLIVLRMKIRIRSFVIIITIKMALAICLLYFIPIVMY